jgi:proteasome lid subunit RPN8/RPN11
VAWSRARAPCEACGLLLGRFDGARIEVVDACEAHNRAERPHERFELEPLDHLAAEDDARARGLAVVGVWHAHPGRGPEPSESDRRGAVAGWTHVVVGLATGRAPVLGAWRAVGGRLEPEVLSS